MKNKQFLRSVGKLVVAGTLCGVFSVSGQSTLALNLGSATSTISKALYGCLMENYGRCIYGGVYVGTASTIPNTNGMRNDVIQGFTELGIGCIEFPGGCFADKYHFADGLGAKASRPGGDNTNGMGTDEYFQLCEATGAIPYLTMNIQSASTAEQNAWLNYIDTQHVHPNANTEMKYWKIGNEEWSPCGSMTQATYQSNFDSYYTAESATWKGRMMNIMDGGSGGGWIDADNTYEAGKSTSMGISYHYYAVTNWTTKGPSSGFTVAQYYAQLGVAWSMAANIDGHTLSGSNALCVDEWGAWYDDAGHGTSFNWSTVRDAVIAAMNLNIFNNRCAKVKMALVAQPVNVIQSLMLTNSAEGGTVMRKTPVFWVFKMLKPHQNAKMVPATMTCATNQNIPVLNASASVDTGNVLHISIVNTHDATAQSLTISLANIPQGNTWYNSISGQMVNGAAITSGITSFTATDTASLQSFTNFSLSGGNSITTTLPAHSVVMLTVWHASGVRTPGAVRTADDFSIKTLTGGKIVVNYTAPCKTPIRLELYGIDGRTMVESFTGNLEAGQKTLVWQPKNRSMGTNVYIVKMEAGEVTKSERLVITK
jgi:alpha-N-arabinofuranosidase